VALLFAVSFVRTLPVVQSTKFEFVIYLEAAKALGIEVPISIQLLVGSSL
jgi:hypothetical protein